MPRTFAQLALLAAVAAAEGPVCGARGGQCYQEDEAETAMLQHTVRDSHLGGLAEEGAKVANNRIVARIGDLPTFRLVKGDRNTKTLLRSVIPVFPPDGGAFIAFVGDYNRKTWPLLRPNSTEASGLECVSKDGHRSPVEAFGAEQRRKELWTTVYKCAWPDELRSRPCHNGSLVYRGDAVYDFEACHDPAIASEGKYEMAACIEPLFESPDRLSNSGIVQLPQWLEYNMQKGVQHFVAYTMHDTDPRIYAAMKPFLDAKLMTQVRLEVPFHKTHGGQKTQMLVINDCVQRMRGRAKWLLTSVDTDEFIVFNSSDSARAKSFPDAFSELVGDELEKIHAVTFSRYNFLHPKQPYEELQIASPYRERRPFACPKYVVRPDKINALWVHFPQSWDNGTYHLGVHNREVVAYHYRMDEVNRSVVDTALASQAPALDAALQRRYGQGWVALARGLAPTHRPHAMALAVSVPVVDQLQDEDEERDPDLRLFTEYIADLQAPTRIDGELDSIFGA